MAAGVEHSRRPFFKEKQKGLDRNLTRWYKAAIKLKMVIKIVL